MTISDAIRKVAKTTDDDAAGRLAGGVADQLRFKNGHDFKAIQALFSKHGVSAGRFEELMQIADRNG